VHEQFDITPSSAAAPWRGEGGDGAGGGIARGARLVVIGRLLRRAELEEGFAACFAGAA
jgi:hypothetical protein